MFVFKKSPLFNELEPPRNNDRVDASHPCFIGKSKIFQEIFRCSTSALQCQLVAISMANKHGSCTRKIPQKYYHLVMTNSSPWKITIFNR